MHCIILHQLDGRLLFLGWRRPLELEVAGVSVDALLKLPVLGCNLMSCVAVITTCWVTSSVLELYSLSLVESNALSQC